MASSDLGPSELREAFGHVPSAVVAIAALVDGARIGMVASTFVPVSLDPPLVSVCIQSGSATWQTLERAQFLGVSVLSESHSAAVRTLSSKTGDRFAGIETDTTDDGAVFVAGAGLRLTVCVDQLLSAGDHIIATLSIRDIVIRADESPIVFHRSGFRTLSA